MWAWAVPAAISAVTAIAGINGANRAADLAEQQAQQAQALQDQKIALAQWQLDDFKKNTLPLRDKMLAEAMGTGPTAAYGREVGSFQGGMAKAQENILSSDSMPTGLMSANLAGLDIAKARGMATLRLQDDTRKQELQKSMLSIGYQNPGAVTAMGNALGDGTGFFTNLAGSYNNQAAAGYGAAASSMGSLAKLWAENYGGSSTPASSDSSK